MTTIKRSNARLVVLVLISIGTTINYLDRAVLGVAAPALTQNLGLSAAVMGLVFSAFSWTYTLAQIPGGVFLDRFGSRLTYFLSATVWSAFTLFQGFISGLISLLVCRLGLGVAEAPCYRFRHAGPQTTNRNRAISGIHDHWRQLRRQQRTRRHPYVDCIFLDKAWSICAGP